MKNLKSLSKFLTTVLRHRAADFEIALDEHGYANLDSVWRLVEQRFRGNFTKEDLAVVVSGALDDKKRLEINGNQIRALYGHSRVSEIIYEPVQPPEILYHGTSEKAVASIRIHGIQSMSRQYAHLSTTIERATSVARRHTERPVILRIRALEAHLEGITFYHPEQSHYLCRAVPPQYIDFA